MPDRIFPTYADDKSVRFRPLILPYIALALWVGLGYNLGDAVRTNTPSFEGAKGITDIQNWGIMFLIGAVVMAVTSMIHETKWMRLSLFIGGVMYVWWGCLFVFTLTHVPNASIVAPGLYAFIAFAHFAAAALPPAGVADRPTDRWSVMKHIASAISHRQWSLLRGLRPWKRHSLVLAVAGVVYVAYGMNLVFGPGYASPRAGLAIPSEWFSLHAWGIVWIVVGLCAFASTRWPPASETWGYSAMSGLAAFWGAVFALGPFAQDAPLGAAIPGALIWSMVAFMWWGISGLRNPEDSVEAHVSSQADHLLGPT